MPPRISLTNNLTTTHPNLILDWDYELNTISPLTVGAGSKIEIAWKCHKCHRQWDKLIPSRVIYPACPYESGKLPTEMNNLAVVYPELAAQLHPIKNGSLDPYKIFPLSNIPIWWKCPVADDHEWEASPNGRTYKNVPTGCPMCSGHRTCLSNSIATTHPHLLEEWIVDKNLPLTPETCVKGRGEKVWWRCKNNPDHIWDASITNRANCGSGCPICVNQRIGVDNCLATLRPDLCLEWHPTKNGMLTPHDVGDGYTSKIWWRCSKNHEWDTTVSKRVNMGRGCPYCAHQKPTPETCLAGSFPEMLSSWHPTLNGDITPYDIMPRTHKKYWWICEKGHEWKANPSGRVGIIKSGCPVCKESKGEKAIAKWLECSNIKYVRQYTFADCIYQRPLRFDFYLPELNTCIEYDGEHHYFNSKWYDGRDKAGHRKEDFDVIQLKDHIKTTYCANNNIPIIRIPYWHLPDIPDILNLTLLKNQPWMPLPEPSLVTNTKAI